MGFLDKRRFDRLWLDFIISVAREFPDEPSFKTAMRLNTYAKDLREAATVMAQIALERANLQPEDAVAVGKAFYFELLRERFPGKGSAALRTHGSFSEVVDSLSGRYPRSSLDPFAGVVPQVLAEFVVMRGPLEEA